MGSQDKVSVVTGAVGGMGLEISTALARRGDTVILIARDAVRGEAAVEAVRSATGNAKVHLQLMDFASLDSVRRGAAELLRRYPRIDVLSHNAAIYSGRRKLTADGHELMFGVNHLAPTLLTMLLRPALTRGSRVVFNTGEWKEMPSLADLQSARTFKALDAFAKSKSANNMMAKELAQVLAPAGIQVNAVHPGFVKTKLVREAPAPLRLVFAVIGQTQHEGARWPIRMLTADELDGVSGKFFVKDREKPFPAPARDDDARAHLWSETRRILGVA